MTKTAIGYTRLSQDSDTSIDRQKKHIRAYARERGMDLVDIYDDGEQSSGFDSEREQYQKFRQRLSNGVDAVVVNDKRRLARDVDEVMRLVPELRTEQVELHTHQDGKVDLSDPMRAAIEILMAAAAHEEKLAEIEKAIESVEERRERGCYEGRPPFGLEFDDEKCHLRPSEEFDTVRNVLLFRERGKTYAEIAEATEVPKSTAHRIVNRRETYERYAESSL